MEGEVCAVLGICVARGWIGWECGQYSPTYNSFPCYPLICCLGYRGRRSRVVRLTHGNIDGHGTQIPGPGVSPSDTLLWYCECYCKWTGYAEVCIP